MESGARLGIWDKQRLKKGDLLCEKERERKRVDGYLTSGSHAMAEREDESEGGSSLLRKRRRGERQQSERAGEGGTVHRAGAGRGN